MSAAAGRGSLLNSNRGEDTSGAIQVIAHCNNNWDNVTCQIFLVAFLKAELSYHHRESPCIYIKNTFCLVQSMITNIIWISWWKYNLQIFKGNSFHRLKKRKETQELLIDCQNCHILRSVLWFQDHS